jgi:hypothetical protein
VLGLVAPDHDGVERGLAVAPALPVADPELHDRFGGSRQDGISPSRTTPNVFVFTDPRSGEQHGYYDQWAPDGSFRYTGRGQRGPQTLTSGNRACSTTPRRAGRYGCSRVTRTPVQR